MKYYLPLLLFCFFSSFTFSQNLHNRHFNETCAESSTGICYWDLSWGSKESVQQKDKGLLLTGIGGVVFIEQSIILPKKDVLQKLSLTAKIKTQALSGKGAGLNISIYDKEENLLVNKDLGGYGGYNRVKGSTEWDSYQVKAIIPQNSYKAKLGFILYGKGEAYVDDFDLSIQTIGDEKPSALAVTYISSAIDTLQEHALMRDSVDLGAIKNKALAIAGKAQTPYDCHLAVEYMLQALGDHHSFFMSPEAVEGWSGANTTEKQAVVYPTGDKISDCAYVKVPFFHGGDQENILAYADSLQQVLAILDAQTPKGWIIDLRENTGGNMEPMILGLGPIFSGTDLGSLIDINQRKESWKYEKGAYLWNDEKLSEVSKPIFLLKKRPIAVLMGAQTGSSGEAVLISFIGNERTRTFGQPSWGLTTGNGDFDLADGARMMLASTRMADRNGKIYIGKVVPDEHFPLMDSEKEDIVLNRAIQWISEQKK